MAKTYKNLFLQSLQSYDLKTWHAAIEPQACVHKVYINDDPVLTLTYFTAWLPMHLNGEPEVQ